MDGRSSFLLLPPNGINFRSLLGKITSIVSSPPPRKEVTFSVHVCRINSIRVVRGEAEAVWKCEREAKHTRHLTRYKAYPLFRLVAATSIVESNAVNRPKRKNARSIERKRREGRFRSFRVTEKGRGERRVACSRGSKEESLPLSTIFSASLSYRWIKIHPMPLVSEQTFLK